MRLDREGDRFGAVETRWRMSNALSLQGQVADAVAVLETLVETPIGSKEAEEAEAGRGADSARWGRRWDGWRRLWGCRRG